MSHYGFVLVVYLAVFFELCLSSTVITIKTSREENYYRLPRFWTNTGFCPLGEITNKVISDALLSSDVQTNLEFIGALPNHAISSVRVHWLLELVKFIKFKNHGVPVYDFAKLDRFIAEINKAGMAVGFEFMGTPNDIFTFKNISRDLIWEDLSFQIVHRYLEFYGVDEISKWKFESWNEPDLKTYNKLNFSIPEYLNYLDSLRRGLNAAARTARGVNFQLHGPAGLFKNPQKHALCWSVLDKCNKTAICPVDILTFHRKGLGGADEVISGTKNLLKTISQQYPKLIGMKISNDEADPIAGWSTPRPFQSDVRYAVIAATIIFKYWSAMLDLKEFEHFESISHDNAFLSYHPYEFHQRTLLARFQMNLTTPPHTQFIQKPVYAILGMLGNLGKFAQKTELIPNENMTLLATASHPNAPLYLAYVLMRDKGSRMSLQIKVDFTGFYSLKTETLSYIIEVIETDTTDPVKVWNFYGKPYYPNATVREEMRRSQGPKLLMTKIFKYTESKLQIPLSLRAPWFILFRMCSSDVRAPFKPYNLRLKRITHGEVLLIWKEIYRSDRCLKTYEIYFSTKYAFKTDWNLISRDWHVPFLSFHFQPRNGIISGSYKVRAVDIFDRRSEFSNIQNI